MKAELKFIYNQETDKSENYFPPQCDNFCLLFRAVVGPRGGKGEESFDIQVCTPLWLLTTLKKDDIITGRHLLIVQEYNFNLITNKIKQLIESFSGEDWRELAQKIGRIGYWEFEDYQE